jgi:hypothetical protein
VAQVPVSKVELYAAIRHDARVEGLSSRALSAKYGVGRRTVSMALASVWPAPRKQLPARGSRLDAFKAVIDQMLRDDLDAPRKQRHTVKRVFDRLIEEHDAQGVTYSMVRAYIFQRRPEIRIEEGRGPPQAFVPQTHRPGDEAEVDFGDVWIHLQGVPTKVFLFSLRLSFSGKAVHKIFLCTMSSALQWLARPTCRDSAASGGTDERCRAGPLPEGIAGVDR